MSEKIKNVCAGIDIGGTNTEIGLIDPEGNQVWSARLSTRDYPDPTLFVNDLCSLLKKAASESGTKILSVGIGAPSANYFSGCIEYAPNMPWKGIVPLVKLIEEQSGCSAIITNDANAAAIGEQIFGAAKGLRDFMVVTLGTGLGSGIVSNDQLVYGHDGFAGELGHVIIELGGRTCGCGRKGCLETYVSATGIVITAQTVLTDSKIDSAIRGLEKMDSRSIADAASQGDLLSLKIIDYTAEKLGFALANAVAITSPSHIFLYGGMAKAGELLFAPTRKYFEKNLLRNYGGKVKILASALPEQAAVLGAAAVAWKSIS
jgi:glucokinase